MSDSAKTLMWGGVVIVAVVALGAVVTLARRIYVRSQTEEPKSEGFTIEALEELRDSGEVSTEEFSRLRSGLLGREAPEAKKDESQPSAHTDVDD